MPNFWRDRCFNHSNLRAFTLQRNPPVCKYQSVLLTIKIKHGVNLCQHICATQSINYYSESRTSLRCGSVPRQQLLICVSCHPPLVANCLGTSSPTSCTISNFACLAPVGICSALEKAQKKGKIWYDLPAAGGLNRSTASHGCQEHHFLFEVPSSGQHQLTC